MGMLSYLVPDRLTLRPGDAVLVPFGRSEREGMVVAVSDVPDPLAAREVVSRLGSRAHPADVGLALTVAADRLCGPEVMLALLAPRGHRDAPPHDAAPLELVDGLRRFSVEQSRNWSRRVLLCPPALPLVDAAAQEAFRMAEQGGQVLVLCPTVAMAGSVRRAFRSGAALLSSSASAGVWTAWRRGRLAVAVGTRSSVLYSPRSLAGVVVVDDAHPGHVGRRFPYVDAVAVAGARSEAHSAALSLVSRVPSARGLGLRVKVVEAEVRGASWPSVRVIDRSRFPPGDPASGVFAAEVSRAGARGLEAVVVAERSPSVRKCARCALLSPCGCGVSGCAHRLEPPCRRCGGQSARWSGWDAVRCRSSFPAASVATLEELSRAPGVPRLVVVPEVARLAHVASSRPSGLAASVLVEAAAAAGPGGRLVVGSWDGGWAPLGPLRARDLTGFARAVYEDARTAGLPPFGAAVVLSFDVRRKPAVPQLPDGASASGPFQRSGVWEVEVRCPSAAWPAVRGVLAPLVARRSVSVRFL